MMDEVFRIYEEGVIAANGPNSYVVTFAKRSELA